jgi:hypothetical protein
MPRSEEVPDSLRNFAHCNACEVADRDFDAHVERLLGAIDSTLGVKAHVSTVPSRPSRETIGSKQDRLPRHDKPKGDRVGKIVISYIEQAMENCAVFVAIIGPNWVGRRNWGWRRPRIFSSSDPVHIEVRTALIKGIPIVPVLLDGTRMPERNQLPRALGDFHDFNAADLSSGREFNTQSNRVMGAIDGFLYRP